MIPSAVTVSTQNVLALHALEVVDGQPNGFSASVSEAARAMNGGNAGGPTFNDRMAVVLGTKFGFSGRHVIAGPNGAPDKGAGEQIGRVPTLSVRKFDENVVAEVKGRN